MEWVTIEGGHGGMEFVDASRERFWRPVWGEDREGKRTPMFERIERCPDGVWRATWLGDHAG